MCGAIFSKLTNSGVQSPNGSTQFYPDPNQAVQALATASRATAQPGGSSVDGTINSDGTESERVVNTPPPDLPQPRMVTPNFVEANSSAPGSPLVNKELTTKGKVLSLLLQAGEGAAAGAAAGAVKNPHISPGLGEAAEAGVNVPFNEQQKANELRNEQLKQNLTQAEINALPQQQQTELNLKRAQTTWYNQRGEAVGEHNLKAGDTLVDKDGNVIGQGADVAATAAAKATGKATGTAQAVQNLGGTPAQVLSALGVKNPTAKNTSVAQMYLDANNGDAGAAVNAMNRDKVSTANQINTTVANLRAVGKSDTAAVQRTINADPQYSGLKRQRDALLTKLADEQASGAIDASTVTGLQQQADTLTAKMTARRAQIVPSGTDHPDAGKIKYLPNGQKVKVLGVDKNGNAQVVPAP